MSNEWRFISKGALALAGLLGLLASPGCAGAQAPLALSDRLPAFLRVGPLRPSEPEIQQLPVPDRTMREGFANPSFEQTAGEYPADWLRVNLAGYPEEGAEGSRSARVSSDLAYFQRLALDLPAWQTVTVAGQVRGQLGVEASRYYLRFLEPSGASAYEEIHNRPETVPASGEAWQPHLQAITRRGADAASIFEVRLLSRGRADFVDFDAMRLLFENPTAGDFEGSEVEQPAGEGGWAFAGGAALTAPAGALAGSASLELPPGAAATQTVAHAPHVAQYFVTGRAAGAFELEVQRFDATGSPAADPTVYTVNTAMGGFFIQETGQQDDAMTECLVLRRPAGASGSALVDDVGRGFAYAWPPRVLPQSGSGRETVRLAAAWQGYLQDAQIAILDSSNAEVDRIAAPSRDEGSAFADYDPAALPPGDYTARFELTATTGQSIMLDRPFTVEGGPPLPPEVADFDLGPDFQRAAWIWLVTYFEEQEETLDSVDEIEAVLQAAVDDGFNLLVPVVPTEKIDLVRQALARVGAPYIFYDIDLTRSLVAPATGHRTFTPTFFTDEMEAKLAGLQGDPNFRGIMVFDEPNGGGEQRVRRVEQVMREIDRLPDWPAPWATLNPNRSTFDAEFSVIAPFFYPHQRTTRTLPEELEEAASALEPFRITAQENGRPFWIGPQAFAADFGAGAQSAAEARMHLGGMLAMGAQGSYFFLYYALPGFSGLRTLALEPLPRLAAFQEFNQRIESLWPRIANLPLDREAPAASNNAFARLAQEAAGDWVAFVVNPLEEESNAITIELAAAAPLENLETLQVQPAAAQHVLTLGPGDWAVVRSPQKPLAVNGTPGAPPGSTPLVTETSRFTASGEVTAMAIEPDGAALALIEGPDVRVRTLNGTELFGRYIGATPGAVRALGPQRFFAGSDRLGWVLLEQDLDGNYVETRQEFRHTGGALDYRPLNPGGDQAWLNLSYRGTARADLAVGGYALQARVPLIGSGLTYTLHHPQADRVTVLDETVGLVPTVESGGVLETFLQTGVEDWASYFPAAESPEGRLALPRMDAPPVVAELAPDGFTAFSFEINDPAITTMETAAWLSEQVLALGEFDGGVRFYFVGTRGTWRHLATWRPFAEGAKITALASLPGQARVAVATSDNEVIVGDAQALLEETAETSTGDVWRRY